ncbi:tetratricopeptide repeat protein [Marinilabiliaceae bacterium N1Y90]|nr:tetratricopeptide repeat protein [Marinilabiliaceae bacterium N1Y90]
MLPNQILAAGSTDSLLIAKARKAIEISATNPDSTKLLVERIFSDYSKTDTTVLAYANKALGEYYYYTQNFDSAKIVYKKALDAFMCVKDTIYIATVYNDLGLIDYYQGAYDHALFYFSESLKQEKLLDNELGIASSHHNIGMVYGRWERYDQLFEHYNKALLIYERLDEKESIAGLTNNMGVTYASMELYEEALKCYKKSYMAFKEMGDKAGVATISSNLGCLFVYLKQNQRALAYFNEALDYFKDSGDQRNLIATYSSTGDAFMAVNNKKEAMKYYLLAEEENKNLGLKALKKDNYYALYKAYKEMGQYENALSVYEQYNAIKDSIFTTAKYERLIELEKKYHVEKSEKELIELRSKEDKIELYLWMLSIFVVLSVVIVSIGLYAMKMKERQRRLMMEQKVLRNQMNPHFIFNALSALQCVILEEDKDEAISFISDFSSLMRLVLQYAKEESISLEKEREILQRYMSLQNRRFDKKINYQVEVDPEITVNKTMIPPMLTQPFLENALEHGELSLCENATVKVKFERKDKTLVCSIEDNGVGIKASKASKRKSLHKSVAMDLTKERIALLYGNLNKSQVEMQVDDLSDFGSKGTRITFVIPFQEMN